MDDEGAREVVLRVGGMVEVGSEEEVEWGGGKTEVLVAVLRDKVGGEAGVG
jgi:hypothetical protein